MNIQRLQLKAFEKYKVGDYDAALKTLAKIQRLDPKYKDSYYLEAGVWKEIGNVVKEHQVLEKVLPLLDFSSPEGEAFAAEIFSHIAATYSDLGLHGESKKFSERMLKLNDPKRISHLSDTLFQLNAQENISHDYFRTFYNEYKKCLANIKPYPKKFYNHKKIRAGFLSADFRKHAVINWSWSLLNDLDKNLFETYLYSNVKTADIVTEHLRRTIKNWRDIQDLTDEQAAELIHDEEIDILFDLSGHSEGNRLCAAAYHPASVQISGIGYMNSTGLECFDYFLSDIYCAGDENFFTEKLIKLPRSHICYEPPTKLEPAAFPPCLKNKFVTFGSFNQSRKTTDSILFAWKKILDTVPDSRLILKNNLISTKEGKDFFGKHLKSFGFDLARIELRGYSKDYLSQYADVDIALDTFPYPGGVTTCEALYMGVPVVSLYGARHGTRFGLSILKNVGLDELAVNSYADYVSRAIELAGDWELLTILRKNLRTMMKKSPLMDSQLYLHDIEQAFIKILDDERRAHLC